MTWFARAVFVLLVGATFAAFFVAQRLKGAPPVVELRQPLRYFSPDGDGRRDVSRFSLLLKEEGGEVRVDVIDAEGNAVRRLAAAAPVQRNRPLPMRWDGRDDAGRRVPDGPYRVRLGLREEGRSVTLPTLLTVDTRPPQARVTRILPAQIVGPRAPAMRIYVRGVSNRYPTRLRVLRTDEGEPREVARFRRAPGLNRAVWDGRDGGAPAGPGTYVVEVSVRDRAGNWGTTPVSLPPPAGEPDGRGGITVRAIAAQPPLRPVTAGEPVEFFVDARQRAYRWTVRRPGSRRPVKRGRVAAGAARPLELQAPRGRSGLYLLRLRSAAGGTTTVPFLVQSRDRAALLVVVPAITWLGADAVDDPPFDGFPNTLAAGGPVRWPRVFSGDGRPAGLTGQIAPLLAFLDHRGIRYDLTSDLDLALSTGPRATDRPGVLLPAPARWVTRPLARRLRRYVLDGGRLATFGVETLRRGVSLRANPDESEGRLLRPTQPTAQDPFGASLLEVRDAGEGARLEPLAGDATYGLLTGTDGLLEGFGRMEESSPPAPGGERRLIVGLGTPPPEPGPEAAPDAPLPEAAYALTAARVGEGLVIRVGLPEWQSRLGEPEIAQVTRNVVDLLRGDTPRIRSAR